MSAADMRRQLTPAMFQVMLALASGHAHGYGIMSFLENITEGAIRLGPGTLYRTLARLVSEGLVEETEGNDPDAPHDARRRYYSVTARGRRVMAAEARLLFKLTQASVAAGILDVDEGTARQEQQ